MLKVYKVFKIYLCIYSYSIYISIYIDVLIRLCLIIVSKGRVARFFVIVKAFFNVHNGHKVFPINMRHGCLAVNASQAWAAKVKEGFRSGMAAGGFVIAQHVVAN